MDHPQIRIRLNLVCAAALALLLCSYTPVCAQYVVEVHVVNLQISVFDRHSTFITDLKPEDFLVWEDGVPQEVIGLDLERRPFSIGILLDTSASMESAFRITSRATEDFIYSLHPEDEFFLMHFDERLLIKEDFMLASRRSSLKLEGMHFGVRTRLYDAIITATERLREARYPQRALFVISDGINTWGGGDERSATELAQKSKVIIYSLVIESQEYTFNPLRALSEATGGSYFVLKEQFPRVQAAYEKIAADLAHRFTLYYRSNSDYTKIRKPDIKVQMKNPDRRVRFQKTYFPQ